MQKIMFSEKFGLQQAVLNGSKTMTRRIEPSLKILPEKLDDEEYIVQTIREDSILVERCYKAAKLSSWVIRPRFHLFEKIAVAQRYADVIAYHASVYTPHSHDWMREEKGWSNKMYVKADLMPHQIEITDYRIERMQYITEEDCLKEGIMEGEFMNTWDRYYYDVWGDVPNHITFNDPKKAFISLIRNISGNKAWESNPYVLVYSFRLVK